MSEDRVIVGDCDGAARLEDDSKDVPNLVRLWNACLGLPEPATVINPENHWRYLALGHLAGRQ